MQSRHPAMRRLSGSMSDCSKPSLNCLHYRCRTTRKCITSKSALFILQWSFIINFVYLFILDQNGIRNVFLEASSYSLVATSVIIATAQCFYPLAGHLADTRFGRHKTVVRSLWLIAPALLVTSAGATATILLKQFQGVFILSVVVTALGLLLVMAGIAGFKANMIQLGLDQLRDAPSEDQTLFIHWYMWTVYTCTGFIKVVTGLVNSGIHLPVVAATALTAVAATAYLFASLSVAQVKKKWFLIEPRRASPYRLVYLVSVFAQKHKVPLKCSAFTYCEDEIPSGLDLGKGKYGGPFTTEQVEDVKAFYGILKILLSLGPMFFMDVARDSLQSLLPHHLFPLENNSLTLLGFFIHNNLTYPLMGCLGIPIYLVVIRPITRNCTPKILHRLGCGVVITVFLMMISLATDTALHFQNPNSRCIWNTASHNDTDSPDGTDNVLSTKYTTSTECVLILQQFLRAVSHMLFYVALYEFLCSQSPPPP